MRLLLIIIILSALHGCNEVGTPSRVDDPGEVGIPDVAFVRDEVIFNKANSLWLHPDDSSKVSGYVMSYYPGGVIAQKFGVVNGKKEGESITFFPDGQKKFSESYRDNRLHGEVCRWVQENGYQQVAQLRYEKGKLQGEQRKWYTTGELHKLMQMEMGKEEGLQQAFRKNGALYANYEAKNGRVFGMKRSNMCFELDNEQVVYKQ